MSAPSDGPRDGLFDELRERIARILGSEGPPDSTADGAAPGGSDGRPGTACGARDLGDYRILREVGRGGMGVVYEAEQVSLGRRVALKILPDEAVRDPGQRRRFEREARAAARLHHTNIVPVFGVGEHEGTHYYVMQFIPGLGLNEVIAELRRTHSRESRAAGPTARDAEPPTQGLVPATVAEPRPTNGRLAPSGPVDRLAETLAPEGDEPTEAAAPLTATAGSTATEVAVPAPPSAATSRDEPPRKARGSGDWRSVARVGVQVAGALDHAHRQGILHRDIKPANLLLDTRGTVWVTDFGLAKSDDQHDLTQTGDVMGTLRYMPPEAFKGKADARSDIYALGLTLYELIALRPAFLERDRARLVHQVTHAEPPRLASLVPEVPRDLATIVHKAIERDPSHRYATAGELADDLQRFLDDRPILARPIGRIERTARWCRRNPALATLVGAVFGLLAAIAAISTTLAFRIEREAEAARVAAHDADVERATAVEAARNEADARRQAVEALVRLRSKEDELRETLYAARTGLAMAAWDANEFGRLHELLESERPRPGARDLRGWEWDYLWRLGHEERLTFRGHDREVSAVAFRPGGRLAASVQWGGTLLLWDPATGAVRHTIGGRITGNVVPLSRGIYGVAFTPDGRRVAGPGPDGCLALWDADIGRLALRFEGDPGAVQDLAFSPDGRRLAAGTSTHIVKVWDAVDGRLLRAVSGHHQAPVNGLAFSPDGKRLASSSGRTIHLWDAETFAEVGTLKGHTDTVRRLAFSPDGKRLASAGSDRAIRIWDPAAGAEVAALWGHTAAVYSVAFSPDGARLASAGADATPKVWDLATGQAIRSFKGHIDSVFSVAFAPDGRQVASASADRTVQVWDTLAPPTPLTLKCVPSKAYGAQAFCVAFGADGTTLASGHADQAIRVWDAATGDLRATLTGHLQSVSGLAFSPDGRRLASGSLDATVKVWDLAAGRVVRTFDRHGAGVKCVAFSPDGRTIASASDDRTVMVWDVETSRLRTTFRDHAEPVYTLAFSRDGRRIASAGEDQTIRIWDAATGRPEGALAGHAALIYALAFSPDGRTIASASADRTVKLWDVEAGAVRATLAGHYGWVRAVAFSPDGRRLVSAGVDRMVKLWDAASGQDLLTLRGHSGWVRGLAFSRDGRRIASSSDDGTVKVWDSTPRPAGAGP